MMFSGHSDEIARDHKLNMGVSHVMTADLIRFMGSFVLLPSIISIELKHRDERRPVLAMAQLPLR